MMEVVDDEGVVVEDRVGFETDAKLQGHSRR